MHPLLVQRSGLLIQATDRGHLVAKSLRVLRRRVEPGAGPMRLKIRLILKNAPPYAPKCGTRRFRFTASSATSRGVQWDTGRCASSGAHRAMAMISTICSGVKIPGPPERRGIHQRLGDTPRQVRSAGAFLAACKRLSGPPPSAAASGPPYRVHAQVLGQIPVEAAPGGGQHDPCPLHQTLLPRGAANPMLQDVLLSSAELDVRGNSHLFDMLLVIVRGAVVGRKRQPGGDRPDQR